MGFTGLIPADPFIYVLVLAVDIDSSCLNIATPVIKKISPQKQTQSKNPPSQFCSLYLRTESARQGRNFRGLKILHEVPGSRKVLLEIVLILCLFQIRTSYTESFRSRKVKRQVPEDNILIHFERFSKHDYRFVVILKEEYVSQKMACHGFLIAPNIVLTVPEPECRKLQAGKAMATAGMHNIRIHEVTQQSRDVCHIEIHPKASDKANAYMVLYLSDPFVLNDYVATISLPFSNTPNPQECMFPAWGKDEGYQNPVQVTLKIHQCNIDPSVICTEGGVCVDHGSPLVCSEGNREFAVGMLINSGPCKDRKEAYFASFMYAGFMDWLKDSIKNLPKQCYANHG
ncbi:unnamed protein product [Allacma fusca]|uniref:Peptidase S1 domain-containing protein n=1 Tax=Allacma fusca TaxID=39272 RepID=A0A8J2KRF2_9HEXA|nr:unnamed protein product [Allacma fusca]